MDIDVDAGTIVVPEFVLERHLGAAFAHDMELLAFNRRFKLASVGIGRFGSKPMISLGLLGEKEEVNPPAASASTMTRPMYVLSVDFSSLVILPPFI